MKRRVNYDNQDPPFNSRQGYNVLFAEKDGTKAAAQITAFEDTWEWNQESARTYEQIVESGGRVAQVMIAFHTFRNGSDMMAYLAMMAPRLIQLRRALKKTGLNLSALAGGRGPLNDTRDTRPCKVAREVTQWRIQMETPRSLVTV